VYLEELSRQHGFSRRLLQMEAKLRYVVSDLKRLKELEEENGG